jgi:hypothetical protein
VPDTALQLDTTGRQSGYKSEERESEARYPLLQTLRRRNSVVEAGPDSCGSGDCGDEMSCARVWWNAVRAQAPGFRAMMKEQYFLAGSASEARAS